MDINCPKDAKFISGFDDSGRVIYDWPKMLGFEPDSISSITRKNKLPSQWDRYGSLGGDNFATVSESGIKYSSNERSIPYLVNEDAYHLGTFNNDIYFDSVDAIKNNDLQSLNKILAENNVDILSKLEFKDIKSSYDAYITKVSREVGNIDATYGLKGNAAAWISDGEVLMTGGAEQIIAPFNGETLEKLGVLLEHN